MRSRDERSPLVSVIVPTFRHERFIDAAIVSAAEQDYPNVEVVVSDDGSTDGTRDVIRACVSRYPGRVLDVSGEHVGIVANCNRALAHCRGEYLAIFSGDDLFLPGKITRQVAWMEESPRRVMCGHHVEAFDSDTGATIYHTKSTMQLSSGCGAARYVSKLSLFPGVSTFIRRSTVPAGGYDSRVGIVSDFKLMADVLATGGEYGYIDGVFSKYRVHQASVSQRSIREEGVARDYLEGFLTSLALLEAAHPELLHACRKGRSLVLMGEARRRHRAGDITGARAYYRAVFRNDPLSSTGVKALVGAMLPHVS